MEGNQQDGLLRSVISANRSYVRFINRTLHRVVLYWIDYNGQAVSYGAISSNHYQDINTFVSHPWIFVDEQTMDRYVVNQSDVFFPELPRDNRRTSVYITLPMYTLREWSLRVLRKCLEYDRQAFQLDIPRSLQDELARMLPKEGAA